MQSERPLETRTGGRAATTGVIPGDFALSVGNPQSDLPAGWRWRLLTDVARLETGHTPSRRHPEWWGGSVPWIGIRDATGNHGSTIHKTEQYTNELGIRNSSARILPASTVCLSRTASVGYVVVMGVPMATSQDFVNWVCGRELDHRYLKYVLLAERQAFLRFASGTTHQTIYFPEVKAFHIAMPSLEVQRGIAEILGALDDHDHRLIGFPAILPARFERAIYSHHIYRVRPRPESSLTTHVLYYTLMASTVREQIIGCANGSTVNMLKVAGLEIPQFVCPSIDVARAFEELASPLRRQMEANVDRSDGLSVLRDTLLPRLISGKLRIPEAEEQVEAALA